MDGWIKIHRKLLDWEWYDDGNVVRVFLHLLLTANFEPKKWHGITIERGQLATSVVNLASQVHLTSKQIRIVLEKLKNTNEIDIQTTNKYTLITICKYADYQTQETAIGQTNGNQTAIKGQTNGNQRATTKEIKNIKNEKNDNNILGEKTKQSEQLFQNGTNGTELDFGENEKKEKSCAKKETKHKYGEYQNVKLTDNEFAKLKNKYSEDADKIINYFDAQIEMKGYKYKSHYLAILDWGAKAFYELKTRRARAIDTSERDNRNLDGIW